MKNKDKENEKKAEQLKIIYVDPKSLKEWDKNPRDNDEAAERLAEVIKEHSFIDPIIVDPSMTIYAGHTRRKAALMLNLEEVPVVVVDFADDEHAQAYALADNKAGEWANWKEDDLAHIIEELKDSENLPDISGATAFSGDEIEKLLHKIHGEKVGIEMEDDFEPEPLDDVETEITLGDAFALGDHRLFCGDSTDPEVIEKLLEGKKVGMIFTDPPYNVKYGSTKNPKHKIRDIENDSQTPADWIVFCNKIANIVKDYCKGDFYCWGASGPDGMRQRLEFVEKKIHWSATIIWKKQQLILAPAKYQRLYEPCFYGWAKKSSFIGGRNLTEVWEVDRPHNSKEHPTMKPIRLAGKAIRASSLVNDTVMDMFGGSGSTLIACEQLQRRCRIGELDPRYCQIIIDRWERYTGEEAKQLK